MKNFNFTYIDLANLQKSSRKEFFVNNENGAYSYSTICNYNTRKYHGELVVPIEELGDEMFVLLASLDISIIVQGEEFNLGIHKYNNGYYAPHGHKYLKSFTLNNGYPSLTYCVGNCHLVVSKVLKTKSNQLLISIKSENCENKVKLRLRPLLAFRNVNELTQDNFVANTKMERISNGIRAKLYENFPSLYLQTSRSSEFVSAPLWYHDVEYYLEELRGYDYKEDLFVPGYLETKLKKGENLIFSASLTKATPKNLPAEYKRIIARKEVIRKENDTLRYVAKQFFKKDTNKNLQMTAGFPWYGVVPRDIFIANPTLLLSNNQNKAYLDIVEYYLNNLELETGAIWQSKQIAADAPLWLFWSLHKYKQERKSAKLWERFGAKLKEILEAYKNNRLHNIEYKENGLLYITTEAFPMTWMNSTNNGKPIVNRHGFVVEVCGLWYNAIQVAILLAEESEDTEFIKEWKAVLKIIEEHFLPTFTDETHSYLADYVTYSSKNFDVRPNQLIVAALPYTPLNKERILAVLQVTEEELLTMKGIRTLSPKNKEYQKCYKGNHYEREQRTHQGTVYPWLLPFYCKIQDTIYKQSSLAVCKDIYQSLEEELEKHGIGTLGEMFTADPPYTPIGAFSMAKSVAAMLCIGRFIKELKEEKKKHKK